MSNAVLIIGDASTGKSTAIRTLPPEETFIINIIGKPLPFRGSAKNYTKLSADGLTGNSYASYDFDKVKRAINLVDKKRPEIKYLIIDDAGYLIMKDYIKNALVKGFEKYSSLAKEFSEVIDCIRECRDDLFCFVTMHIETQPDGKTKPKTIGNMIDKSVNIEGQFSYIFHSAVLDKQYKFITNNDSIHMAKSPMDMFDHYIDNDLLFIANRINEYQNEDVPQ
jgi:hypothetical protein